MSNLWRCDASEAMKHHHAVTIVSIADDDNVDLRRMKHCTFLQMKVKEDKRGASGEMTFNFLVFVPVWLESIAHCRIFS